MQTIASPMATIIPPHKGKTFSFFGNTVTYKFSESGQSRIYELSGTANSGVPPLHTHPWDEWFYFLEGEVKFRVGSQTI
ncbi:MAG: cupin domain-containing protein, partial [Thermosynechococcaceae cyanobacterium]